MRRITVTLSGLLLFAEAYRTEYAKMHEASRIIACHTPLQAALYGRRIAISGRSTIMDGHNFRGYRASEMLIPRAISASLQLHDRNQNVNLSKNQD